MGLKENETIELKKSLAALKEGLISNLFFIAAFTRPSFTVSKAEETAIKVKSTIGKGGRLTKETPKKDQRNAKEIILEALRVRPEISVRELAAQMGLTIDSIRHHIRILQNKGVIRHVGSTKAGRWEVNVEE